MIAFVGTQLRRPLWATVHVFDPSYRGDGRVCVCGLPRSADIHAKAYTPPAGRG